MYELVLATHETGSDDLLLPVQSGISRRVIPVFLRFDEYRGFVGFSGRLWLKKDVQTLLTFSHLPPQPLPGIRVPINRTLLEKF